jgi:hypothetical protein
MNFHDYLNRQQNEDRRAFIIHYGARSGKTRFARRICETRQDAYLLDLLAYFLEHPELPPIEKCGFDMLKGLLLALDVPQDVIIVDNPDFLFNIWSAEEKQRLLGWLRTQLRSPGVTKKTIVFLVQTDDIITVADLRNSGNEPRVLALDAFDAL